MSRALVVALLALGLTSSAALAQPSTRTCWCFSWVHGPDHGRDCLPTRSRCEQDRRAMDRDTTECVRSEEAECVRDGWVGGQHYRLPVR